MAMSDNRIRMTFLQPMLNQMEMIPTPAWEFKPARWEWLARLCWRFLNKVKALRPHFEKQMMVTSIVIDPAEAVIGILRMAGPLMDQMSGDRPTRVLMGQRQFSELHQCKEMMWRPFSFEVPIQPHSEGRSEAADAAVFQWRKRFDPKVPQ